MPKIRCVTFVLFGRFSFAALKKKDMSISQIILSWLTKSFDWLTWLFFKAAKLKRPNSTKVTHLISSIFQKANWEFHDKIIWLIDVSFFFKAAELKRPKSTKMTHIILRIFQNANVTFLTNSFHYSNWRILFSKLRS